MRRGSRLVVCGLALLMGGCNFMQDRVLDFVDVWGVKFVAGKGMKFGIEFGNSYMSTEYEDFFASPLPMVTGLRRHLVKELGVDRSQVAFMGYWRRGVAMKS